MCLVTSSSLEDVVDDDNEQCRSFRLVLKSLKMLQMKVFPSRVDVICVSKLQKTKNIIVLQDFIEKYFSSCVVYGCYDMFFYLSLFLHSKCCWMEKLKKNLMFFV